MAKEPTKNEEKPDEKAGTEVVAKTGSTDVVTTDEEDFFADAGGGLEDFKQSDMLIPYLRIVQALSKELQKNHAKYIPEAEQGCFVNSATRKIINGEKGFLAIPVAHEHRYMAWRPNNAGPAHDYGNDPTVYNSLSEDDKRKRIDAEGNEVTDSMQFFIVLVDPETFEYEIAVLNFGASQMKKGRGWSTQINNRMDRYPATHAKAGKSWRPAMWYYSYHITTVPESNDQGSWYGFSIKEGPKVPDLTNGGELYRTAKTLRDSITAGEVKAAVEDIRGEEEPDDDKAF